jgi:hypothetical protein
MKTQSYHAAIKLSDIGDKSMTMALVRREPAQQMGTMVRYGGAEDEEMSSVVLPCDPA